MQAKLKDSGIPWIGQTPEHWKKDKILRLFSLIGSGTTPKGEEYYTEFDSIDAIPWIYSCDLNFTELKPVKKYVSPKALADFPALKIYPTQSIIIAMYGASIGKIAISTIQGCSNQACQVLYGLKNNSLKYLFYQLYSFKDRCIELSFGGTQPNINADNIKQTCNIKQTWLCLPTLEEQERIAAWLDVKSDEIDELIDVEQQMISDLEEYRQAVITEAVTGKTSID